MRQALSGAAEAGFTTTVLPQISAGAIFHAGIALGKFHGVTSPTTPIGLRMANMWTRSRSEGTSMPGIREPSPREVAEDVDGAADFALGFGKRLAFLAGHVRAELIELLLENVGGLEQDVSARGRGHGTTMPGSAAAAASAASSISCARAFGEQADHFVRVGRIAIFEGLGRIRPIRR